MFWDGVGLVTAVEMGCRCTGAIVETGVASGIGETGVVFGGGGGWMDNGDKEAGESIAAAVRVE